MLDILTGKVTARDWMFVGGVLALTAVIAVGFYVLVIGHQKQRVETRRQELAGVKKELGEAKKIAENIDGLRKESEDMERLVDIFQKRLPSEREIPNLLRQFEKLGADLGLRVQLASLPSRRESRTETIPYKVTAAGEFHKIAEFINKLERDERYLKVSDLDIGEQEAGVSTATFVLSTFRFIEQEEAAAADAAKAANAAAPAAANKTGAAK
ncbi:MAG TPA: type 4a pilus biogenesis protein PilO [Candidatus Hydrogenedentes bacterium]|nr:type 4a pilus biogenesis protein PilO [Candidatus Hydrogenedentota bacterium]HQL94741.1 type 4a pilus biogenesis protein PilO [Candidatus Hydrogenedentota bacterium]HRZ81706.1 type 4a pilus biogenesis protein PilO [Candidatus Hydrogenedentota bacterium]